VSSAPDDDGILYQEFESVWDALEDDPVEAERLTILGQLMFELRQHIEAQRWTQKDAAKRLGVTQPRISNLVRGRTDLFSIDSLIAMIARAGLRVDVTVREKVPPRTVMRDGTVTERL
jgi:predicted XRE-type DNA-binding protein